MKNKHLWIPWICLWILLLGMRYGICSVLGGSMQITGFIIPFGIIAAVFVVLVLWLRGKNAVIAVALGGICFAAVVFLRLDTLLQDTKVLAYYINERYLEYKNRFLVTSSLCERGDLHENLLLSLCCIILGFYIAVIAFRLRCKYYGMIPIFLLFCGGLLIGEAPDQLAILLLFAGVALSQVWITQREYRYGKQSKRQSSSGGVSSYLLVLIFLAVGMAFGWYCTNRFGEDLLGKAEEYQEKQHQMEAALQKRVGDAAQYIRGSLGMDGGGRLTNSAPYFTEKTIMEITVDQKPSNDVYLRGFTGGKYHNGSWSEIKTKDIRAISKNESVDRDFWSVPFEIIQKGKVTDYIDRWSDIPVSKPVQRKMTIQYTAFGKRSKYAFLPYYAGLNTKEAGRGAFTLQGDGAAAREKETCTVPYFELSDQNQYSMVAYDMEEETTFSRVRMDAYYEFAEEAYLTEEDDALEEYEELAGYLDFTAELDEIVAQVQQILWENAVYSTDLEPVPYNEDYAEYFLFVQQKGYCEHFATAGTLLLRQLDVPSRYVSGYRIPADRFQEQKDGTYTAQVKDSDAHAWSEVLAQNWGWMPEEMTPGSFTEPDRKKEAQGFDIADFISASTAKPHRTKAPVPSKTPKKQEKTPEVSQTPKAEISPSVKPKQKESGGTDGRRSGIGAVAEKWGYSILWILVLPCVLILYFGQKRLRYRLQRRRLQQICNAPDRRKEYIGRRIAYLLDFMRESGIPVERDMPEVQWLEKLSVFFGEPLLGERKQEMLRIARKSAFAKETVSREEQKDFRRTCQQMEEIRWQKIRGPRKLYLWLIFKKE